MVYAVVIRIARALFRLLGLRITVDGLDNVPSTGPVVLAANHVSFVDFLLLGLVGEESGGRRVRFLARYDVWHLWPVGWAMRQMGHIPVDRAAPAHAFLLARQALRQGEVVGIFPEAGVSESYTVRALMPGAVALAQTTGAPLVPVVLWGGQRLFTVNTRLSLRRGGPVTVAALPALQVNDLTLPIALERLGEALQKGLDLAQALPEHQPGEGQLAAWHPAHLGGGAPPVTGAALLHDLPRSAQLPTWGPGAAGWGPK